MLNRFLIIGIGGSGGKTARFLHRELRYRLHDLEWKEGMPAGWQFLQIDVPTEPDGNESSLPEQLPQVGGFYTSLSRKQLRYRQVDAALLPPEADHQLLESYLGWRPVPEDVKTPIEKGAGQFRTLGRMLALHGSDQINQAIRGAISRLNVPNATGELDRLSRHMGNKRSDHMPSPIALIISSVGGGSGAGMVNDVADILRATGESWCDESIGFLFTGEIFQDLEELTRQGVQPNSLAALSEVMAGYWNHDAAGEEFAAFGRRGIEVGDVRRRGVRYPFLIGASNGEVSFGNQNGVYSALGRSLGALMTSSVAQDRVKAYVQTQWPSDTTMLEDRAPMRPSGGEAPFNSIGSATVSLGRDRFARYASQRLARSSVSHLLRAHHVGKKVPDEVRPEDALAEAVTASWTWFVDSCGLDEMGAQSAQVIGALRPPDRGDRIEHIRQEARARLKRFPDATPPQWAGLIAQDVLAVEPGFVSVDDGRLQQAAVDWVEQIQQAIVATTLQAIGRTGAGAEVTIALLERLRRHVTEVVVALEEDERKYGRQAGMRDEGISGALSPLGATNNIAPGNAAIDEALRRAMKTLEFGSEARMRRLAAVLLRDLAENQIVPLHDEVASAVSGLKEEEFPTVGDSVVERWPEDDIIPAALKPAVNERLVESTDEYPSIYRNLIQSTVGSSRIDEAVQTAIRQVTTSTRQADGDDGEQVGGMRVEDMELGDVLIVASGWWPAEFNRIQSASRARYELHIETDELLQRAEEWVGRRDSAIGAYVHESLRSYLTKNDDRGELAARRDRFSEAFTSALRLAPPLIGVSNGLLNLTHDLPEPRITYTFTEIPLDQTEVRQPLVETMRTLGVFGGDQTQEDKITGTVFGTGDEQSIEVITWFQGAFEPIVFDSVMRPIAAEWARRRTTPEGRRRFWQWRRARGLCDFIPLGPGDRRAAVAGWFLARLLGELTWTEDESPSVAITVPALKRQVSFPHPLLGPLVLSEKDILAAVLESLPLAMVECNSLGKLEPLEPYKRLIALGTETGAQRVLRDWILDGTTPAGTTPIPRAYALKGERTQAEATPADRQEAVVAYLNGRTNTYVKKLADTIVDLHGFFEVPRHYELHEDYESSLPMLQRVASGIDITAEHDEGD